MSRVVPARLGLELWLGSPVYCNVFGYHLDVAFDILPFNHVHYYTHVVKILGKQCDTGWWAMGFYISLASRLACATCARGHVRTTKRVLRALGTLL
jgi:hypothetical protein